MRRQVARSSCSPSPPDLDLVAEQVLFAALMNMGENCSCGSRLIVHRSVQDALVERLVAGLGGVDRRRPDGPATRGSGR